MQSANKQSRLRNFTKQYTIQQGLIIIVRFAETKKVLDTIEKTENVGLNILKIMVRTIEMQSI